MLFSVYCLLILLPILHAQVSRSLSTCTPTICIDSFVQGCSSSSSSCYLFDKADGGTVCIPTATCSTFDPCSNNNTCGSTNSICIISSCCLQPVCVPLVFINMCAGNRSASTNCVLSARSTWNQNGTTIAGNSSGGSGTSLSQLNDPVGFHYNQNSSTMYIGDYSNKRVLKWPVGSSLGSVIVANGNGVACNSNLFDGLVGLTFDSYGYLYTSGTCGIIAKFPPNSNSTTQGVIVTRTAGSEHIFLNPLTDDLYVISYSECAVLRYARNSSVGVIVAGGNGCGSGLNQLNTPNSVYYDYIYGNSLYVVDTGNHRIVKFPSNSSRTTYGAVVAGGNGAGNASNQLNAPRDVVVDDSGTLYIVDGYNHRVVRWLPSATSGDKIIGTGTVGSAMNQLYIPESLRFDAQKNLLVVDRGNNRVQRFNLTAC